MREVDEGSLDSFNVDVSLVSGIGEADLMVNASAAVV